MNTKISKRLLIGLSFIISHLSFSVAQNVLKGKVVTSAGEPVAEAVISSPGCQTVRTADDGTFAIEGVRADAMLTVWHDGFFQREVVVRDPETTLLRILMVEETRTRYNETAITPLAMGSPNGLSSPNVNRKDFALGSLSLDRALQGEIAGLQVTGKSGMTGEGAMMQLRGVRSLVADNAPLIVINGVPYLPDGNLSEIVGGYSRSWFQAFNAQDIRNVTVLKGAEAAAYGSMASGGVIMIETDQASTTNMNTRISFSAITGINWQSNRIPLMGASEYKSYLTDMGLTYYANMEAFFNDFSFLSDPQANRAYLYQYDTDWQDEIFRHSTSMDYLFRVEGGDNIAKYNISLGYLSEKGTLKNTYSDRYEAQLNASVLVSKKFEIRANINTAYLKGQYQEQGIRLETNPLLAAYRRSPLLSPQKSDMYGALISTYASYRFGGIDNEDFWVSNPVALVNAMRGKNRQYDMNTKIEFVYTPLRNLTLNGMVGMYYNYNEEETFIPGMTNEDVVPQFDQYGQSDNIIRVGANHTLNMYYKVNAAYKLKVHGSQLTVDGGWQALTTSYEYDAGFGRNSMNDFYRTLGDAETLGKYFEGYNEKWNWANVYGHADFSWKGLVGAGLTVSIDGASSVGNDARRWSLYPGANVVVMLKELRGLRGLPWLEKLNVYGDYSMTGNSRFSSKFGKYYYTSQPYQTISGLVRANVPNTRLKAECDGTLNVGFETSLLLGRLSLGGCYYNTRATDVVIGGQRGAVLGTSTLYTNEGELVSKGVELSIAFAPVYSGGFHWWLGGNVTTLNNKVKSLGSLSEIVNTLDDDAQIVTRRGEDPYSFYGLRVLGVFSTTAEATEANLMANGRRFEAGDVHYADKNGDGVIDGADREVIGSATPTAFGSFFTRLEYKRWALDMTFVYSVGNDAYNAVRRLTEGGKDFSNAATSVNRRWLMEGQQTDIPRVRWADRVGNNAFSERWIEDGSYVKLRDVTLSYTWQKPLLNLIEGGTVFIAGENLLCFTGYLGLDAEFSYSYSALMQGVDYAKVAAPRSVKVGVNLKF